MTCGPLQSHFRCTSLCSNAYNDAQYPLPDRVFVSSLASCDIMLEEVIGLPCPPRLRIISLMETDWNQGKRSIIACQLGFFLEDNNLVFLMQYGSRPGQLCISAVLNKQLAHDIVWLTKSPAAFKENDTISCDDQLENNLIFLLMKCLGTPQSVISLLGSTWANTSHMIKTAYRASLNLYKSSADRPLFGPGQGSTYGPFLWLLCFCLIMDSIDPTICSVVFVSAYTTIALSSYGEAFVDDSSSGMTSVYHDDLVLSVEANLQA